MLLLTRINGFVSYVLITVKEKGTLTIENTKFILSDYKERLTEREDRSPQSYWLK